MSGKRIGFVLCGVAVVGWYYRHGQWDLLSAMLFLSIFLILAFYVMDRDRMQVEKVVLVAVLSSFISISRIPFAALPSVQPVTFLVMMSGALFGQRVGFLTGAMSAFISNLFLGQGPWTPWQMIAWGAVGVGASHVASAFQPVKIGLVIFGAAAGFLFGWWMNVWVALAAGHQVFFQTWILACMASFPMDVAHAVSNILFMHLFYDKSRRIFVRVRHKYNV